VQAQFLGSNPFAILTAIVAPAILTNASSVAKLGLCN
jgi:branched-subunit amino acid transport protein